MFLAELIDTPCSTDLPPNNTATFRFAISAKMRLTFKYAQYLPDFHQNELQIRPSMTVEYFGCSHGAAELHPYDVYANRLITEINCIGLIQCIREPIVDQILTQ